MQIDIHGRSPAVPRKPKPIEFLRVQLAPGPDGSFFVGLTATTVDEADECFELVEQEIASEKASGIEAALAVIAEHARRALQPN